ncbi:hypothetical protein EUBVEN_00692 [Eubacterium ventriosum ATCC 27560]|uniref:Uncharacterized protein n=1 Tax=Eubacterium ventriosum ATCC 27560 TaxID=411463 RepID=A5Z4R6_9FIRM|nr:hypothetical protein EUBVEN_00692 [Eubacterium ventriosum ATCC 27560]
MHTKNLLSFSNVFVAIIKPIFSQFNNTLFTYIDNIFIVVL